jgi:hypothetical protein
MSYKRWGSLVLGVSGMLFLLFPVRALAGQQELAASIAETRTELMSTSDQLRAAVDALNNLQEPIGGDLKKAYDALVIEIGNVETAGAFTKTRSEAMKAAAAGHFESWQKDIDSLNNAQLRKASQKRLTKVQKIYDEAVAEMKSASTLFKPCLSDLSDISKVLSNDLTAKGVSSINSVIRQAKGNLQVLSRAIGDAMQQMELAEKALSSGE